MTARVEYNENNNNAEPGFRGSREKTVQWISCLIWIIR